MIDTKCTPGEWQIVSESNSDVVIGVRPDSGGGYYEVCEIDTWASDEGEGIANAHLIAAAPDLYQALHEAKEMLEEYETEATGESFNSLMINAALAKARGEENNDELS